MWEPRPSSRGADTAADALLRPALEAAVAVARAGEDDIPAQAAPVALRPFLHFAKLPPRALVAARRALDADAAFRARVAEQVSADDVGPGGWLLLTRPPGWEAELDAMARRAEEERAVVDEQRAEDGARRRLGAAEGAARRAEEAAAAARAELAEATVALAEERRARRAATKEVAELARRAEALAAERDQARADAEALASQRDQAAAERAEAVAAGAAARTELRAAAAKAADDAAVRDPQPKAGVDPAPAAAIPVLDPSDEVARRESAAALGLAADAARALADSLSEAARALAGAAGPSPSLVPSAPDAPRGPRAKPAPSARSRLRPGAPKRTAAPLPPAIFEESLEAAEHLARLPGVVVLVDGYNVSQAGWPGTPIAEQRRRLVDALAELVARTGADVRVVFDGADTAEPQPVPTTARSVRVRFSPPDVEADDVIVAEVGDIPASRPVVVASSDRRVRDESQARGANLLRSSQLLALLRR